MQEATEVSESNDWFTYAEPLHRLREFGNPNPNLDTIQIRLRET